MEKFRQKQDILEAKRKGNTLFEIYQTLECSTDFLEREHTNSFEVLNEMFLNPLTEENALELANFSTNFLYIYTKQISPSIAEILSKFQGRELYLDRLQQIGLRTAKILIQWNPEDNNYCPAGKLSLNGLIELNEATAEVFAQWEGIGLSLNGLQHLDEATAESLAQWKGEELSLDGLKNLDKATAEALFKWKGSDLHLNGLKELDEAIAKYLSQQSRFLLDLNGIRQLDESTAEALFKWKGGALSLNGIQKLDEAVAKTLTQYQGRSLFFNGLRQLDKVTAKAISEWSGEWLELNGIQQLDEATAKALAKYKGTISSAEKFMDKINKYKLDIFYINQNSYQAES